MTQYSCGSRNAEFHRKSGCSIHPTDFWGVLLQMYQYSAWGSATCSYTKKSITLARRNAQSLLQATSHTISKIDCVGWKRGYSQAIGCFKRTLSYLHGWFIWSSTQAPMAIKIKTKTPICKPTDDAPGKQSSADTLVAAQPGLIPQMSGTLTNLQIIGATIFVDHYSNHTYIYLMQDLSLSETLAAKHAYERFLGSLGIESKAYHADNGCFADKGFWDDCHSSNQTISICGVGSHHQNGIA
jgi:hypothetical protein